jgi:DNA polymerase elongation subunit (family B)
VFKTDVAFPKKKTGSRKMVRHLQPCDWQEHDWQDRDRGTKFYVIDVYGRGESREVVRLRIVGFKPYFYTEKVDSLPAFTGVKLTECDKHDIFAGFDAFQSKNVYKVECTSLASFRESIKIAKAHDLRIYESNLPPLLKFFHERGIAPASPLAFQSNKQDPSVDFEEPKCDFCYIADYRDVQSDPSKNIPLKVASYDIECYSESGNFPLASNPSDAVIQIGVSYRWSNDLMKVVQRKILVVGSIPEDPEMISCHSESELLQEFANMIEKDNPDILVGYNTFGFDDKYIIDRAHRYKLKLQFGRARVWMNPSKSYPENILEHKKFELATGTYIVNFLRMPGRSSIDLLLNMRREQNLDSYKLDNVASTFLRDKVVRTETEGEITRIYTKSTRGLRAQNFVKFDIVGNTSDPYREGEKFTVMHVAPNFFEVRSTHLFEELNEQTKKQLEWTFTKDDIHPQDIFRLHRGGPEDRALVAKYCLQDCDLLPTLMAKLDTLINARGMADVCMVPLQYLFLRGQGIKIYSRVAYEAMLRNQIILTQEGGDPDGGGYEGAIVISPKIGMYLDQPIAVLDYNSLYPSAEIAENLSPDTFVCEKIYDRNGKLTNPQDVPTEKIAQWKADGFKIREVRYDIKDGDNVVGKSVCMFVEPREEEPLSVGIIPQTLKILLAKRKEVRQKAEYKTVTTCGGMMVSGLVSEKEGMVFVKDGSTTHKIEKSQVIGMDDTYDDAQKSVFNGLQLAYKVVANSVYGQMGSPVSPIRKKCVAACTTAVGRDCLLFAKDTVEKEFGAEVVYGDSVAAYTPVTVRVRGGIQIVPIEKLDIFGEGWMKCENEEKEICILNGVESWTETGWTPIRQIVRHKLSSDKKMIRVLTHTGLVDVTDDHSLLKPDTTPISPKVIQIGTELLHHDHPSVQNIYMEVTEKEARIAGFFFGDGSCGIYDCPSGKKASWALNNANLDLLTFYKQLCEEVYPQFNWMIHPTLVSSNVFKLTPGSNKQYGKLTEFIAAYRGSTYCDKAKRIPLSILNGSYEVRQAFWDGLYDADGDKDMNGYVRIDQKNQISAAHIGFLATSLGYKISINTRADKPDCYRITCTKSYQRKNTNAVKKLDEIAYQGYVYDLTTENHHFAAGIGHMIVHNTDSIFIKFPTKDLAECIELGKKAAERITSQCRKPLAIGYEKTLFPFILFCRKRYVGMLYEDDPTAKPKRKSMGIVLRRRDNAPIVKDVFGGALDILLARGTVKQAADFVKDQLTKVVRNQLPMEKFVITKQLRDDYKDPGKIAHRVLADRMSERDPGNAPAVGDRMAFVYIQTNSQGKKVLQGDRIESVDYAKEKKLKPDTQFYITNQIQNPVSQLFALCIDQLEGYTEPRPSYKQKYEEFLEQLEDPEEATLKVLALKEKQLDSLMFLSSPMMKNLVRMNTTGPLDRMFAAKPT